MNSSSFFNQGGMLDSLLDSMSDGVVFADKEGNFVLFNKPAEKILGVGATDQSPENWPDYFGVFYPDRITPFPYKELPLVRALHGESTDDIEQFIQNPSIPEGIYISVSGRPVWDPSGDLIGSVVIFRDITLRKKAEQVISNANVALKDKVKKRSKQLYDSNQELMVEKNNRQEVEIQLRQSQKMEAIGRLAGGIAHDFNNLLTAISGYADLVAERVGDNESILSDLGQILLASEKAATLTHQLLAFGRKQELKTEFVNLNHVSDEIEALLRRLIGEHISLKTSLSPDLWTVEVDAGQIEQVIMNLVVNARDAMPHGGKLTIETANVVLDEEYAEGHFGVTPGEYVFLAVSDTGMGMDEVTRQNIFEPFFTTKGEGLGTGLGLATVYGIVKQSGGDIWVYSELDQGTTFKIYLPRAEGKVTKKVKNGDKAPLAEGTETILVVEDEEMVRTLACTILEMHKYTVLEASDGEEALSIAEEHSGPIHLLLSDVILPKLHGPAIAEVLKSSYPDMSILFVSGYTAQGIASMGDVGSDFEFLQKPFSPRDLLKRVNQIFGRE